MVVFCVAAAAAAVPEDAPFELLDTPVPDVVCEPYKLYVYIGNVGLIWSLQG